MADIVNLNAHRKRKAHQRQWLAALLSQPAKMESQAHG